MERSFTLSSEGLGKRFSREVSWVEGELCIPGSVLRTLMSEFDEIDETTQEFLALELMALAVRARREFGDDSLVLLGQILTLLAPLLSEEETDALLDQVDLKDSCASAQNLMGAKNQDGLGVSDSGRLPVPINGIRIRRE